MANIRWLAPAAALLLSGAAAAQSPTVPGLYYGDWVDAASRDHDAPPQELKLINYFFTRGSFTNTVGDPSGLKGVALGPLGTLAGSQVTTDVGATGFVEQRWIPVVEYTPNFLDGRASFRAQLEIDYLWGWAANQLGQNQGGGFNADQVNIQTKNVNVAWYPFKDPDKLTFLIGTQPLYDNPLDPTRTGLNEITRTGYKLAFVGSDATGLQVFSQQGGRTRLAWFPLNGGQPKNTGADADPRLRFTTLTLLDHQTELAPGTWLGASVWHLRDSTEGAAFTYEGLVRAGPTSAALSGFTGTQPFQVPQANGQVTWLGVNAHHNIDFRTGRFGASGFFMYNFGKYTSQKKALQAGELADVKVNGWAADGELLWNYGRNANDLATLEAVAASGDDDSADGTYHGPFTLNYYGLPGAVFFNHRMMLLMPFTSTVGNYTGAVTDLSNQGYGLVAVMASVARDLIPNKLNLKLGAGYGRSLATPPRLPESTVTRGKVLGTELNAELKYTYRFLMTFGLHGAYMLAGDWFDGNGDYSRVKTNPYAVFTTLTWYAF